MRATTASRVPTHMLHKARLGLTPPRPNTSSSSSPSSSPSSSRAFHQPSHHHHRPTQQQRSAPCMCYKSTEQQETDTPSPAVTTASEGAGSGSSSSSELLSTLAATATPVDDAPKQQQQQQQQQQQGGSKSVQLSFDDVMADMVTMLGDSLSTEQFTGYAGQWRTWEVLPADKTSTTTASSSSVQPQPPTHNTADTAPTITSTAPNPTITSTAGTTTTTSSSSSGPAAAAACLKIGSSSSSSGQQQQQRQQGIQLIDDGINVRLWRRVQQQQQPVNPADADAATDATAAAAASTLTDSSSSTLIQQANFYHHPKQMAGPSTRFAPYLTGNTMSGRPDGYGLRVWSFNRDSDMLNPDASCWLDGSSSSPPECSMRVLTVPHQATTIINGALPSGFGQGHTPQFWVLEFIAKEAGSSGRRWSSMNWYDLGELVVNRSINEDLVHLSGEPDDITMRPDDILFSDRREGLLPLDIDTWVTQHTQAQHGTATAFSFASVPGSQGAQALHLTRTNDLHCTWHNPFAPPAANAGGETAAAGSAPSGGGQEQQGQTGGSQLQQQVETGEGGGGLDVVVQVYPDWSYCRVPRSIRGVVEAGQAAAVFEAGTVLRDGTLVRWLLEYETSGTRLIKAAAFQTYPPTPAAA